MLPAERCEPNQQMSLLALEKSRTLWSWAGRGSSACQEHIPAPQGHSSRKSWEYNAVSEKHPNPQSLYLQVLYALLPLVRGVGFPLMTATN